jgi:hypothetical protein
MNSLLKKIIFIFSIVAVSAFIILCALYGLGVIFGTSIKAAVKKEYTDGEITYTYTGMLLDGKINGRGEIVFSNGDRYIGELDAWRFQGKGTFHSSDGWYYEGEFDKGRMTGNGKLYIEGNGILLQNPDSIQDFFSSAGWNYIGGFNERGQTGKGKFIFADGAVDEGEFVRGMAEGQGSYQSTEGWSYTGEFQQGAFNGEGTITQKNGRTQSGAWVSGIQVSRHD